MSLKRTFHPGRIVWLPVCLALLQAKGVAQVVETNWLSFSAFAARTAWIVADSNICSVAPVGLKLRNGWHKPIVFNRHFMHLAISDLEGRLMPPGRISPASDPRAAEDAGSAYAVIQPGKSMVVEWPAEYGFSVRVGCPDATDVAAMSNKASRIIHVPALGEYRLLLGYNCRQQTLRVVDPGTGASRDHNVWHGVADLPPVSIQIRRGCEISLDPEKYDSARGALGGIGCYAVRSEHRWEELLTIFRRYMLGEMSQPTLRPDFSNEMVVAHFVSCDSADTVVVSNATFDEASCRVDFHILPGASRAYVPCWKMTGIVVPAFDGPLVVTAVNPAASASTGGDVPCIEWRMADGWGDVSDGLQARLAVDRTVIKAGEDIVVSLVLRCVAPATEGAYVWDNKYSEGYRNDSYYVTFPSGAMNIFRRPAVAGWDKNIPRPVLVEPGKEWQLGGWAEGEVIRKSLRMLGLDTSASGSYTIHGVFSQEEGSGSDFLRPHRNVRMWGGTIAAAPVTVRVE